MKVEFKGFGEAEDRLRVALMDIAGKCSDGIVQIGCEDTFDLALSIATVRHCFEVFLAANLLPVLTVIEEKQDEENAVGMAVLFKTLGLACEQLEEFFPDRNAEEWRKLLWNAATDELNGKTGPELAQNIAQHYPEVNVCPDGN